MIHLAVQGEKLFELVNMRGSILLLVGRVGRLSVLIVLAVDVCEAFVDACEPVVSEFLLLPLQVVDLLVEKQDVLFALLACAFELLYGQALHLYLLLVLPKLVLVLCVDPLVLDLLLLLDVQLPLNH